MPDGKTADELVDDIISGQLHPPPGELPAHLIQRMRATKKDGDDLAKEISRMRDLLDKAGVRFNALQAQYHGYRADLVKYVKKNAERIPDNGAGESETFSDEERAKLLAPHEEKVQ